MQKSILTLLMGVGGLFTTWLGSYLLLAMSPYGNRFPPRYSEFLNYHQIGIGQKVGFGNWILATIVVPNMLYLLSLYVIAGIFQQRSRYARTLEPSLIALGGAVGLCLGNLWGGSAGLTGQPRWTDLFWGWCFWLDHCDVLRLDRLLLAISLSLVGIRLACLFEGAPSNSQRRVRLSRAIVPMVAMVTLWFFLKVDFPGVNSPAILRQLWAYKEFIDYPYIVKRIKTCDAIRERVGTVKVIAPTVGKNYTIYDAGSSGHHGEMTLEVIGTQNTGVLNFEFSVETELHQGRFMTQGRQEVMYCPVNHSFK